MLILGYTLTQIPDFLFIAYGYCEKFLNRLLGERQGTTPIILVEQQHPSFMKSGQDFRQVTTNEKKLDGLMQPVILQVNDISRRVNENNFKNAELERRLLQISDSLSSIDRSLK